jgi:hypothetical protein
MPSRRCCAARLPDAPHTRSLPCSLIIDLRDAPTQAKKVWGVGSLGHRKAASLREVVPVQLACADPLTKPVFEKPRYVFRTWINNYDLSMKPFEKFAKKLERFIVIDVTVRLASE